MTNYLRPDEMTRDSEIKKSKGRTDDLRSGLQAAASMGTTALGATAASKVLPFINQYIPHDLALKGISKVMPSLGKFLNNGVAQGLSLESGFEFIKEQLKDFQSEVDNLGKEPAKENRSIIEQYSPNIHRYISDLIKQGNTPSQAALKSQKFLDKKELEIIKKIEKDHKSDWPSIVESIFGGGQSSQPPPQQQPGIEQPTTGQPGQGQQALMQMLQQINQRMGKK